MDRREYLKTIGVGLIAPAALAVRTADAAGFPPVSELMRELALHPGDRLPKLIPWRGRLLQPVFRGATHRGGGRYVVELELL